MELLQLKYFCHAAETENFSQTARAHMVPHSNISQCIKKLEAELGTPLFSRNGNRVTLNARGQAFYQEIRSALDTIERATAAAQGSGRTTLRIGIHLAARFVMQAIAAMQQLYPDVDVISKQFVYGTDPSEFDLITSDDSPLVGFTQEKLFTDQLCLVAAKGSLPEDPLNADFLRSQSFVTIHPGSKMYADLQQICASMGFSPRISLQCRESLFVLRHVETGAGLAVLPRATAMFLAGDRVDLYPIGDFTRTDCLYTRKNLARTPAVECFTDLLKKELLKKREYIHLV